MDVQVTGKHVDVGDALRTRVATEVAERIGKYFDRGGGAEVVVSREGHAFRVDCTATLASGAQLSAHGLGGDAHLAFDAALLRLAKRIRRYAGRLKNHHQQALAKQAETAAYFILRPPAEEERLDEGRESAYPEPVIVAETEQPLRTMTVAMAVMELDLTASQTIVFRNAAHGGLSVVYRRNDGNIGWIDPERTKVTDPRGTHGTH